MVRRAMSVPELMVIAATRAMLGFGLGLLLADRFSARQRRRLALPLVVIGALSTVPILRHLLRKAPISADSIRRKPARQVAGV
jgi:hypothetical protein